MKRSQVVPEFVEFIPEQLQEGVLYISDRFNTAVHLCCCGCGHEVVTPLSPADWKLRRMGRAVTLSPSIGNWSFACMSHYWIRNNRVVWAPSFTPQEIRSVQRRDRIDKTRYISQINAHRDAANASSQEPHSRTPRQRQSGVLSWLLGLIASWIKK